MRRSYMRPQTVTETTGAINGIVTDTRRAAEIRESLCDNHWPLTEMGLRGSKLGLVKSLRCHSGPCIPPWAMPTDDTAIA